MNIKATLKHIIFYNEASHYIVGSFSQIDTYHYFTATGVILNPLEDNDYDLEGDFINHPRFGNQFKIESASRILPKKQNAIVRFLSGSDFPTIGKKTAEKIYEILGENCLEEIVEKPSLLEQIPGLNKNKRQIILNGMKAFEGFSKTYLQLKKFGLDEKRIALLEATYKNPLEIIKEDCFRPYYEVYGFGYQSACKLADGMEVPYNDQKRFDAYVYELCRNLTMATGSTFLTKLQVLERLSNCSRELFDEILNRLYDRYGFHVENDKIYSFNLYQEEKDIASLLKKHWFPLESIPKEDLDQELKKLENKFHIQYDPKQIEAIHSFFKNSISILNGGPGTGKTTTVQGILSLYETFYPNSIVQLCAPTGRASKRLGQLSHANSKTIHSLLKWNKDDNTFGKNEDDPLELDVLIIDEFSMVDTHLFVSLLKALPSFTRILLIGDEDQLESVGPGKVFSDLIDAKIYPLTKLEKIHRQTEGSGIVSLAKDIRQEKNVNYKNGVIFLERTSLDISDTLTNLCKDWDIDSFQILAPMYKGVCGIDAINSNLQNLFNPANSQKNELKVGTTVFREYDKVMLLKNMPEEDVYNGDIGYIQEITKDKGITLITVDFDGVYVEFTNDFLYYLKHAYCISVHKSQGSEYDKVCCVVDSSGQVLLDRRLLYTGISRAKKELYIIGQKRLFENQLRLKTRHLRQTSLISRLKEL